MIKLNIIRWNWIFITPILLTLTLPLLSQELSTSTAQEQKKLSAVDKIVVDKSKRKLDLYHKNEIVKTYTVALGFAPVGHKLKEGDGKTPEGTYQICQKNSQSRYHKSLRVSYPSQEDQKRAKEKRVKPGGDIMVHGLGKEFSFLGKAHILSDWTLGCIALTNEEIEEIYDVVKIGTPIQINP